MPGFITRSVGDVISEILMSRTAFRGSFLVLEGDTDSKFFSRRIAAGECQIVIAGGRSTVIGAVIGSYRVGQIGVLGIIDDDYDSLCGVPIPSPHIVRMNVRDIEALLLSSPAFNLVLEEVGVAAKRAAFELTEGMTVRDALARRGVTFGRLRLLDKQNGWKYDFDTLSPWRFTDEHAWTVDEAALVNHFAQGVGLAVPLLTSMLAAVSVPDPYALMHGRDTVNIFAIGLRRKLSNQQHPVERIAVMLRLAFDDTMAAASQLFQDIRRWEQNNPPFRVLA